MKMLKLFLCILEYLKKTYQFYPKLIATDCSASEILAIRKIFPDYINILCYCHIIKRYVLHLHELKTKNKN